MAFWEPVAARGVAGGDDCVWECGHMGMGRTEDREASEEQDRLNQKPWSSRIIRV